MPEPKSPVFPGKEFMEAVVAKDQKEYMPLPAVRFRNQEGSVVSRWELTAEERQRIAEGADVYVEACTFGGRVQPLKMIVMDKTWAVEVYSAWGYQLPATEEEWKVAQKLRFDSAGNCITDNSGNCIIHKKVQEPIGPVKCCERDDNNDGDCYIHRRPKE